MNRQDIKAHQVVLALQDYMTVKEQWHGDPLDSSQELIEPAWKKVLAALTEYKKEN